jgi:Flp pilus assembly protein TadD
MDGGDERAHLIMGKALMAKSDLLGAEAEFLRVEEMHPGDSEARQLLAALKGRGHSEQ